MSIKLPQVGQRVSYTYTPVAGFGSVSGLGTVRNVTRDSCDVHPDGAEIGPEFTICLRRREMTASDIPEPTPEPAPVTRWSQPGRRPAIEMNGGEVGAYWLRDSSTTKARALVEDAAEQRRVIATAEATLDNIVQQLRALDASWAVIGTALGVSKAAAFKRYAHRELV